MYAPTSSLCLRTPGFRDRRVGARASRRGIALDGEGSRGNGDRTGQSIFQQAIVSSNKSPVTLGNRHKPIFSGPVSR